MPTQSAITLKQVQQRAWKQPEHSASHLFLSLCSFTYCHTDLTDPTDDFFQMNHILEKELWERLLIVLLFKFLIFFLFIKNLRDLCKFVFKEKAVLSVFLVWPIINPLIRCVIWNWNGQQLSNSSRSLPRSSLQLPVHLPSRPALRIGSNERIVLNHFTKLKTALWNVKQFIVPGTTG